MLYEMVTGSRAFPGMSTAETLDAVIRTQPKPPSTVVAEIQGDLEKVILRCLRKEPQRAVADEVKSVIRQIDHATAYATRKAAIETAYARKQSITAGVRVFFYREDRECTFDSPPTGC